MQLRHALRIAQQGVAHKRIHVAASHVLREAALVIVLVAVFIRHFVVRHVRDREGLAAFDAGPVKAILAVGQLDQLLVRVAHRTVVGGVHVLQRLHELALQVARVGRLDGRVDEPLTAGHRVEVELVRLQALDVPARRHPTRGLAVVVQHEVRQCAAAETEGDAAARDVLLAHEDGDLANVKIAAFAAGLNHYLEAVRAAHVAQRLLGRLLAALVQRAVHIRLERLQKAHACFACELAVVGRCADLLDGLARLVQYVVHLLERAGIRDGVLHAHREGKAVVKVGRNTLHAVDELRHLIRAALVEDDVDEGAGGRADDAFCDRPHQQLPALDHDLLVVVWEGRLVVGRGGVVDLRQDEGEDLLAGPERTRLEDRWYGQLPQVQPQRDALDEVLVDEGVFVGEAVAAEKTVLHDAHAWSRLVRRDKVLGHHHHLNQLRLRQQRLRHV